MIKPHLALLAVTLIYGLFYVAIKIVELDINPWQLFCLRLFFAVPLMFLVEKCVFKTQIAREDWLKLTGLGLLGVFIVQSTIVLGVHLTTVFHTGFIVGVAPLVTIVISLIFHQEKIAPEKLLGIAIAMTGVWLLLSVRNGGEVLPPHYLWGDAIVFLNILGWSLFLVLSRPLLSRYNPFSLMTYAFLSAWIISMPLIGSTLMHITLHTLTLKGWLWLVYIVVFATIGSYSLTYYGLAKLNASTVTIYILLQPFFIALIGHWFLNEPLTLPILLEGLMILVGVAIATGIIQDRFKQTS